MAQTNHNIVLFGNERLATGLPSIKPRILPALVEYGFKVAAVVSNQKVASGQTTQVTEVEVYAQQHNIPILASLSTSKLIQNLTKLSPTLGVLVAYGKIVPPAILDLFPQGIINLHPSLLPLYRGSTPIEQAILDGTPTSGVSIMRLEPTMDTGPIYTQTTVELTLNDSKSDLANTFLHLGAKMIMSLLSQENNWSNNFSIQDSTSATYTKLITKSDGEINWQKPAVQLEREVRAYLGWPGSYTTLAGRNVIITAAGIAPIQGQPGQAFKYQKQLAVCCGQDALVVTQLKPAGKRLMTGQEFLAGNTIAK